MRVLLEDEAFEAFPENHQQWFAVFDDLLQRRHGLVYDPAAPAIRRWRDGLTHPQRRDLDETLRTCTLREASHPSHVRVTITACTEPARQR